MNVFSHAFKKNVNLSEKNFNRLRSKSYIVYLSPALCLARGQTSKGGDLLIWVKRKKKLLHKKSAKINFFSGAHVNNQS